MIANTVTGLNILLNDREQIFLLYNKYIIPADYFQPFTTVPFVNAWFLIIVLLIHFLNQWTLNLVSYKHNKLTQQTHILTHPFANNHIHVQLLTHHCHRRACSKSYTTYCIHIYLHVFVVFALIWQHECRERPCPSALTPTEVVWSLPALRSAVLLHSTRGDGREAGEREKYVTLFSTSLTSVDRKSRDRTMKRVYAHKHQLCNNTYSNPQIKFLLKNVHAVQECNHFVYVQRWLMSIPYIQPA